MPMGSVIWSVLLLGGCLIVNVSDQTTIRSSLESTNRMYVCPGEIVTYVCIGTGDQIRLSAPPYVTVSLPLSYARRDTLGLGRIGDGPIVSNLISTDSLLMVADLIVQNSSLPEFSVRCTVLSPSDEAVAQHKPSGPPLDVNSPMIGYFSPPNEGTAGVRVNWTPNDENYDPSHFTIQVFDSNTNTAIKSIAISAESNSFEAILAVPFSAPMDVYACVTVTSKCNQTTDGVMTDYIRINKSIKTGYVFWVLLLAATIVLTII
ncbi:uncharacterized protein LOC135349505 [Halichondria panicea]|uniref:uncharacterized protein LOC135349505 n=1 Tax=Halichondria panicea TaxID=6063 RepID=UPI00312B5BBF